jgi:hypothetical protein
VNGRALYELFRDSHGNERGTRPGSFDELSHLDRMVWVRFADHVAEAQAAEIADAGG